MRLGALFTHSDAVVPVALGKSGYWREFLLAKVALDTITAVPRRAGCSLFGTGCVLTFVTHATHKHSLACFLALAADLALRTFPIKPLN
jgi:hypothetical protein